MNLIKFTDIVNQKNPPIRQRSPQAVSSYGRPLTQKAAPVFIPACWLPPLPTESPLGNADALAAHRAIRSRAGAGRGCTPPEPRLSPCAQPMKRLSLSQEWARWLKETDDLWNWYAHFTFRKESSTKHGSVHPEKADRMFHRYLIDLNRHVFGRHFDRNPTKGVLVARSTEIGGQGGLLHFHAILGRIPDAVRRMEWKENWNGLAGFARIHAYDPKQGGAAYLSKSAYAWKRGEIDLIGPWQHLGEIRLSILTSPGFFAVH